MTSVEMKGSTLNTKGTISKKVVAFVPSERLIVPKGKVTPRGVWPEFWDLAKKDYAPNFYKLGYISVLWKGHSIDGRGRFQQKVSLKYPGFNPKSKVALCKFPVYVNDSVFFMSDMEDNVSKVRWSNKDDKPVSIREIIVNFQTDLAYINRGSTERLPVQVSTYVKPDIRLVDFDYENDEYFAMLFGAYVASFLCGISQRNVMEGLNITRSLARFHLYYHINRFRRHRGKLLNNYKTNYGDFFDKMRKHVPYTYSNVGGERGRIMADQFSETDYLSLIPYTSRGITPGIGVKLLNETVRVYVYCLLSAQSLAGNVKISKSSNAQVAFKTLVESQITLEPKDGGEPDVIGQIAKMKTAVKNTNATLNFAVTEKVGMMPSNLEFSEIELPGYENLPLADKTKHGFGPNSYTKSDRISAVGEAEQPKPIEGYKLTKATIVRPEILSNRAVRHVTIKKVVYVRPKVTVESHKSVKVSPIKLEKPKESVPTTRGPDPVQNKVSLDKPTVMEEEESPTKTPYARLGEWANTILGLSITVSIVLTYLLTRGRSKPKPAAKSATNTVARKRDASGKFI